MKLIQGGLQNEIRFGSLRIVASPVGSPPFETEAIAYEEDTFLVMSADKEVRDPKIHVIRLMTELMALQPEIPGSVVVKGTSPVRMLAIVHDLNQDPTWREEWVASALEGIFRESEKKRISSIALQMIGTLHGRMEKSRFVALLGRTIAQVQSIHLKRLWIIVSSGSGIEIIRMLESELR